MQLTPEDIARLQTKEVANIIRKLGAGKTLTAREAAILAAAKTGGPQTPERVPSSGYAKTWDELADAIGIDRRALLNVRERFAKELKQREPEWSRADGRKDLAWWIRFCEEKDIRGRGANNPDIDYIDERRLRLKERQLLLAKAEHQLAAQKREVLPLAEYQATLRATVSHFDAALKQLPGRSADRLFVAAREAILAVVRGALTPKQFEKARDLLERTPFDHAAITAIVEHEVEAVRATLAAADFLDDEDAESAEASAGAEQP